MKRFSFFLAIISLLWAVGGAAAHAELRSAVPAPGENLTKQPKEIRLTFSEAVGEGSTIKLFGQGFREIEGVEARVETDRPEVLVAAVPNLEPGTYSVDWMVISADGHPASGSYTFDLLPEPDNAYTIGVLLGTIAAVILMWVGAWAIRRMILKKEVDRVD